MAIIGGSPFIIEAWNPGTGYVGRLNDVLLIAGLAGIFAASICIAAYLTHKFSSSASFLKRSSAARFVIAFFSTRGTWYGYVLRVGVIWLGGIMSLRQYFFADTLARPLSDETLASVFCRNSVLGVVLAACMFGVLRHAEEDRRSIIAARIKAPAAVTNRRWPAWVSDWVSACATFAATLIIGDYAGLTFGGVDHDLVFYIVAGTAFVLVCLATLVYMRTNARNHQTEDQRPVGTDK